MCGLLRLARGEESRGWLDLKRENGLYKSSRLMYRWIASDKSTRIPISTFQLALELHGVMVDVDEVECMLANMVYRVSHLPYLLCHLPLSSLFNPMARVE